MDSLDLAQREQNQLAKHGLIFDEDNSDLAAHAIRGR
jgi:hypothetical protein